MPRTVRFYELGGPEVLKIEEVPVKEPGQGEVRLKMEAIALNRAEIMFRSGPYLYQPQYPSSLGYEGAGTVEAVGPAVDNVKVGDRVNVIPYFSMAEYGTYGESVIMPSYVCTPYPDNLTPIEASTVWMQYLAAYGALVQNSNVKEGDRVLITAAASSVGHAAIQIAKNAGATVIATTRSPGKKQALLDSGADHVIVTSQENVATKTKELTDGQGANIILDAVLGNQLNDLIEAASQGATIYIHGFLDPTPVIPNWFPVVVKGLSLRGYTYFEVVAYPDRLARAREFIYEGLKSGKLKPAIDRTFTLDQIVEAHRYMEAGQQNGKIVVTV